MASIISAAKLAKLLRDADPQGSMHVQITNERLTLGVNPLRPTLMIDFSNETVIPYSTSSMQSASQISSGGVIQTNGTKFTRRSGDYWFEIKGDRTECGSLKELLAEGLKGLERTKAGTLDNLSRFRGRSRRIVARDANQLFDKPHLVKEYSERLMNGWYFGTNNSSRETNIWLQRAAECAGLAWDTEFRTSL